MSRFSRNNFTMIWFVVALSQHSAQEGLNRLENLANSKLLSFNSLKSCFVIMGSKKARRDLEEEFKRKPPLLYGKPLKVESQGSYLGEELRSNVSDSVSSTINKRIGLATKAIFEIKSVVEDTRSKAVGGILSGVLLWQSSVLPYLLSHSSCWMEVKKRDMDKLIKLQNLFLNVLLGV